jgi:hypothetical protein
MSVTNTVKDGSGTWMSLLADADGNLKVILQSGSGAAGVHVDDAVFTPGTSEVVAIAGMADETAPDSVDEGDVGIVRMSTDRMLLVQASGRAAENAAVSGNPALGGGRYDVTPRSLDDGDVGAIAIDADGRTLVNAGWTPSLQAEETVDDSDKTFTVPASTEWEIMTIWVELISTATVGNRVISVEIQDGSSDVVLRIDAGAVQAASLTRYYIFASWNADLTAFRGASSNLLMIPFPPGLVLPATYKVRIYDSAAVDAAADDMVLQMIVKARTV